MARWQDTELTVGYDRLGDKRCPAVVLLSGLAMTRHMWADSLIESLLEAGCQVITIDNRDSGESVFKTLPASPSMPEVLVAIGKTLARRPVYASYSLEAMALDVERLLTSLRVERFHVVGHSMGAMIGQVLACQSPNRVANLISISGASGNPATGLGHFQAIWRLMSAPDDLVDPQAKREHFQKMIQGLCGSVYSYNEEEALYWDKKLVTLPFSQAAEYRQLMAILASGDRRYALSQIHVPTLVVHGAEDTLLPPMAGMECAQLIPGASWALIPGMGHWITQSVAPRLAQSIVAQILRHP